MSEILADTIFILKQKGWYEKLKTELNEVLCNTDKVIQEQLLNILKSDKVTEEQIKELFKNSTRTSGIYKVEHLIK